MHIKCPICKCVTIANVSGDSYGYECVNCGSEIQVFVEYDIHVVYERRDHLNRLGNIREEDEE